MYGEPAALPASAACAAIHMEPAPAAACVDGGDPQQQALSAGAINGGATTCYSWRLHNRSGCADRDACTAGVSEQRHAGGKAAGSDLHSSQHDPQEQQGAGHADQLATMHTD